jgi:hypothetical protein
LNTSGHIEVDKTEEINRLQFNKKDDDDENEDEEDSN